MHDSRRTRWGAMLAAGALALTLAAPAAAQDDGITQIGFVTPEQADLGWNEDGLIAAQAAADSIGAGLIDASGGGYGDVAPTLNSLRDDGADFIIAHASGYGATAVAWAKENGIPVLTWEQPTEITPGLIGDAETTNQEGGYLAGVLAATMTQTGELGIVLSASGDPNWQKGAGGFVEGARSVNPDTVFHYTNVSADGYADETNGNLHTTQVIAAGADIVFGEGNGSSFGMLAAVRDNTAEGADKTWFIDVIGDKSQSDWADILLSSVVWDFDIAFARALEDLAAGTYGQEVYVLTAENGGMALLDTPHISDEARAAVEEARAGIADGSITITETDTVDKVKALIGS